MTFAFDPNTFLETPVTEQLDTVYTPIPAREYPAIVSKLESRQMPSTKNPGQMLTMVDVEFTIDDAEVREITGLEQPTARMSVFLDLTDDGKIDTGKGRNVPLGRLRDALDCNKEGVPFTWGQLMGQPCTVAIKHTPKADDPTIIYANVKSVAALA